MENCSFCQPCFLCRCTDRLELTNGKCRQLGTPWQLSKSDWKLTFFSASCETFLPPNASPNLIMALYKFYHWSSDDYRIGFVSEPIPGLLYRIVLAIFVSADITCITVGSAAVNRLHYTRDQRAVTTCHPPRANAVDRPRYGRGGERDFKCWLLHCSR